MKLLNLSGFSLLAFLLCLFSPAAQAWNGGGHRITGAVAYIQLKQNNPALCTKVVAMLKEHDWYKNTAKWPQQLAGLTPEMQEATLFMLASTWPDDIKDKKSGYVGDIHRDWHYVDYPFLAPGSTVPNKAVPEVNANVAFDQLTATLKSDQPANLKAEALCWLLHIIGDIHQPLHAAELVTDKLPDGDRGGNSLQVRAHESGSSINLHSYWDGLLGNHDLSFMAAFSFAQNLIKQYPVASLPELKTNTTFRSWGEAESHPLARTVSYQNGNLAYRTKQDQQGWADAPVLPESYLTESKQIAQKRAVLSGNRMVEVLTANLTSIKN